MAKKSDAKERKLAQVLSSETIYQGPVFGLRRDEVIEPTGLRTRREVITHPGSVVVLPVLPDGRIILIQQYRHATKQYLWELVVFPTPGYLEERMFLMLATGCGPGQASPEDDEKIVSAIYARPKLEQMIHSQKIRDAKTIAGLLYYFRFLAPEQPRRKKR